MKKRLLFVVEILVLLLLFGGLYLYGKLDNIGVAALDESKIKVNEGIAGGGSGTTQTAVQQPAAQPANELTAEPANEPAAGETAQVQTAAEGISAAQSAETVSSAGEGVVEMAASDLQSDTLLEAAHSDLLSGGYTTYALFGIDHRDLNKALDGENSDTIIIACVNNDTKEVRLVSVYRDTLLNIGTGIYAKANAAYAYGGPEQAISMLNTNLDLNIHDYVSVDFNALTEAVDCLGGLDIELSYAEIEHMNNYCKEVAAETGKTYTPIPLPEPRPADIEAPVGTFHLNGVQVTSYCRIRYTASLDMGRTSRQRIVIQLVVDKAKKAGLGTIISLMDRVFPMVTTSISKNELLQMLPTLVNYSLSNTTGFPESFKFSNIRNAIIVPTDLVYNVSKLHEFLYGEVGYVPTSNVYNVSATIQSIVGGEEALLDTQPVVDESKENSTDDNVFFQDAGNGTYWQPFADETGTENSDGENSGEYSGENGGDYQGDGGGDDSGGDLSDGDGNGDYSGDDSGGDYQGDGGGDYSGGEDEYTEGDYIDAGDFTGDDEAQVMEGPGESDGEEEW